MDIFASDIRLCTFIREVMELSVSIVTKQCQEEIAVLIAALIASLSASMEVRIKLIVETIIEVLQRTSPHRGNGHHQCPTQPQGKMTAIGCK